MSTSDTSTIDTKKNENTTQSVNDTGQQILKYTLSIIYSIIIFNSHWLFNIHIHSNVYF